MAVRRVPQLEPSVSQNGLDGAGGAFRQVSEVAAISRDKEHSRVNLVKSPILSRRCVTGHRPGPQPNHCDVCCRSCGKGIERLPQRSLAMIIKERLALAKWIEELAAVHRV